MSSEDWAKWEPLGYEAGCEAGHDKALTEVRARLRWLMEVFLFNESQGKEIAERPETTDPEYQRGKADAFHLAALQVGTVIVEFERAEDVLGEEGS